MSSCSNCASNPREINSSRPSSREGRDEASDFHQRRDCFHSRNGNICPSGPLSAGGRISEFADVRNLERERHVPAPVIHSTRSRAFVTLESKMRATPFFAASANAANRGSKFTPGVLGSERAQALTSCLALTSPPCPGQRRCLGCERAERESFRATGRRSLGRSPSLRRSRLDR